jgi:hypothetical protein
MVSIPYCTCGRGWPPGPVWCCSREWSAYRPVPVEEVGPQVQYGGVEENGEQEEEGREEEGSRVEGAEYTSTRYT